MVRAVGSMERDAGSAWGQFTGPNAAYLLDLYERYAANPQAVDAHAQALFHSLGAPPKDYLPAAPPTPAAPQHAAAAVALATAIAAYGYRAAHLDPLGSAPVGDPELLPEAHGLSDAALAALPAS